MQWLYGCDIIEKLTNKIESRLIKVLNQEQYTHKQASQPRNKQKLILIYL